MPLSSPSSSLTTTKRPVQLNLNQSPTTSARPSAQPPAHSPLTVRSSSIENKVPRPTASEQLLKDNKQRASSVAPGSVSKPKSPPPQPQPQTTTAAVSDTAALRLNSVDAEKRRMLDTLKAKAVAGNMRSYLLVCVSSVRERELLAYIEYSKLARGLLLHLQ